MVRNEEKYEQAVQFRKRGFTLEEIAKICDVSKSTVSKWLKNTAFSADITKSNKRRAGQENAKRLKLINKARNTERSKSYKEAERSAVTEYQHYKNDRLFVAGLMLYVADGDLTDDRTIRFSTSNQLAHKVFITFCRAYFGIEKTKIRFWLLLYPGQFEEASMRKWKRSTGLSLGQFHKTQYLKNKPKKKPLHSGVGHTIIGNTVLKRKLQVWIKLAMQDLAK